MNDKKDFAIWVFIELAKIALLIGYLALILMVFIVSSK